MKSYGLSKADYYRRVRKNVWIYEGFIDESDEKGIDTLYDLTRN